MDARTGGGPRLALPCRHGPGAGPGPAGGENPRASAASAHDPDRAGDLGGLRGGDDPPDPDSHHDPFLRASRYRGLGAAPGHPGDDHRLDQRWSSASPGVAQARGLRALSDLDPAGPGGYFERACSTHTDRAACRPRAVWRPATRTVTASDPGARRTST